MLTFGPYRIRLEADWENHCGDCGQELVDGMCEHCIVDDEDDSENDD